MQSKLNSPFFSIHTPTYKRVGYLSRVWGALCDQTYKNFEWIVADDGSDDGTLELLRNLKNQSLFPVIMIAASKRVGKTALDNRAIKLARGEMFIWNDSDDVLLPNALELIYNAWSGIPLIERVSYCGITALCEGNGRIVSSSLPFSDSFDTTWLDLRYKHKVTGDMLYSCRTDILRSHLPPEVDFLVAESSFWDPIGAKYKTRVIDKVVKKIEYNSPNCISFSSKIQYCRGYVYAMSIGWSVLSNDKRFGSFTPTLKQLITYFRYAIHGDLSITKACSMLPYKPSFLIFILVLQCSFVIALKDRVQGKVCKTHLEFNSAIESVT
ncbi:glycosyltransferase family 2 protein, partial [bacterium]|nr:glycosyltransferase family 2 protein [bacterium]